MTADVTPAPGSLTVPPLHGWVGIVVLVLTAVAVGVAFLLIGALGTGKGGSPEWQAWLDARSRAGRDAPDGVGPSSPDGRSGAGPREVPARRGTHLRR